jgi:hypothetical protein
LASIVGNITAGNVSATGNVAGAYLLGDGSQITGISVGAGTNITNGTSNVTVALNGNVTVGVTSTPNVATFTTAGITANSVAATSNGAGTNFKVGDDTWIGDINLSDTMSIRGQQNAANAYIVFGNADSTALGRSGSGPLTYGGAFSASGNVTGNYILGNGALLTGVITSVANINSGNSNVTVVSAGGNISVGVGGTSNVVVWATTGEYITGLISASGNITGSNILTGGLISATGNITAGALISASGNITASNITAISLISGTTLSASSNILTAGLISATGNITAGNILGGANVNATLFTGTTVSVTGNITGGNVLGGANVNATTHTGTTVSVTGNITGGNLNAAGLSLSSNVVSALNSTSNITTTANISGGNLTAGTLTLSGNTISSSDSIITIDPATAGNTGAVIIQGNLSVTGNVTYIDSNTITTNDLVINVANNAATASAANGGGIGVGPVTGAYASLTYNSSGNTWTISNGATVSGLLSASGNVTGGNLITAGTLSVTGNIVSTGSNGVANIGSASTYFNTVHAKATSAQYADLAEKYLADQEYEVGTVLAVGGDAEVTACQIGDRAIGAVSENPAFKMNDGLENGTFVALKGRVPVKVIGTVRKGQRLVAHNDGCAVAGVAHANDVFAVALESSDDTGVKIVEALIL